MIERPVTTAKPGTPCGWKHADPNHGTTLCGDLAKNNAIHVLTEDLPVAKAGTALCAYHSPFDPTEQERAAIAAPELTQSQGRLWDQLHLYGAINLRDNASRSVAIADARELVRRGIAVQTPGPSGYLRFALVK